jgi:hypothetical protein
MRLVPYGLPLGATINVGQAIEMVHPVFSIADHLRRAVECSETLEAILAFRKRLRSPTYGFIDPALLEQCDWDLDTKLQRLSIPSPVAA